MELLDLDDSFGLVVDGLASRLMLAATCKRAHGRLNIGRKTHHELIETAAAAGSIPMLEHYVKGFKEVYVDNRDDYLKIAAKHGHEDMMWHIATRFSSYYTALMYAAQYGQISIIKIIFGRCGAYHSDVAQTYKKAALHGHLHILEWISTTYRTYDDQDALYNAVRGGHLSVVEYLVAWGAVLTSSLLIQAINGGHTLLAEYIVDRGEPITKECIDEAISTLGMAEWICLRVSSQDLAGSMKVIITKDNYTILQRIVDDGIIPGRDAMEYAAEYGTLDMMKYVRDVSGLTEMQT